jgi:hypothetical protein
MNVHRCRSKYQEQLDEAAIVYSTSKTHSVVYRGALTKLFVELGDGIKGFFDNMLEELLVCFFAPWYQSIQRAYFIAILTIKAKLLSFSPLSPITAIIDGFTDILSTLILKTGHILDILNEASKSIIYGNEHLGTVHTGQAGKLLKSANFQVRTRTSHLLYQSRIPTTHAQNDLKILGAAVPATITTMLAIQGTCVCEFLNLFPRLDSSVHPIRSR